MGGLRDNMNLGQPGDEVLNQVDDIGKQLLGGSSYGLVEWAQEKGIAPEPIEWTKQV